MAPPEGCTTGVCWESSKLTNHSETALLDGVTESAREYLMGHLHDVYGSGDDVAGHNISSRTFQRQRTLQRPSLSQSELADTRTTVGDR